MPARSTWKSPCRHRRRVAALVLVSGLLPCAAPASDSGAASPSGLAPADSRPTDAASTLASGPKFRERVLLVDINRQQLDVMVLVLEDEDGALYLSEKDLQQWRLRVPAAGKQIEYQGERYFSLTSIQNGSHAFDPRTLTLIMEFPPEAFSEYAPNTQYAGIPRPSKPGHGGFFNYDLLASHAADSLQRAGQFEFGYFNRFGVGTATALVDNIGPDARVTRLDSAWTVDYPEEMRTLRLGDAINRAGAWGRSVSFGGIQYGSNFGTQPGFVTFPPQSAAGQAVLPSTVDVFVNNALAWHQNVPPGPFSIGNLPVVTGAGEVELVVRDALGREQLVTRPFYASQALLRPGLEDFSWEFGFVRENYGIDSADYGTWLGSGTYRRGLSERLTGEVHAEAVREQAAVGAGGDFLLAQVGTIGAYLAGSRSGAGSGALAILGIERQARPWSFAARTQWASAGFAQVGLLPGQREPIQSSSVTASYAAGAAGSIGGALVSQHNRYRDDVRIATLSYSASLGRFGSLSIAVMRNLIGDTDTTIFALLSFPLGPSTSLSFSPQFVRGGESGSSSDLTVTLQRSLPLGEGYGYSLMARTDRSLEATYSLQTNTGTYSVGAARAGGATAARIEASGGVAVLDGDAFVSRRVDQSFAVARVADYPDVRILADNQPAGRTDAHGNALIPGLRAYDSNVISIDQRDVPMDAEIGTLKLVMTPYFRSGVDAVFPVRRSRGATLTLRLDDGAPMPTGASVQIVGDDRTYAVGFDGEAYVTGLGPANRLRATWRGQSCAFDVALRASADPLPDLGTFICKGVRP